jgi:hypothetical protein
MHWERRRRSQVHPKGGGKGKKHERKQLDGNAEVEKTEPHEGKRGEIDESLRRPPMKEAEGG